MTKNEALKMAIEAMKYHIEQTRSITSTCIAINVCKEALQLESQPEPVVKDYLTAQKPLSDEEIMFMYIEPRSDEEMIEFARAIEKAHGIG